MKKERNALRAGSFIFVTLALIGGIIVGIRGLGALELQHTRTIAFTLRDDIGGLQIGDDVRVGGFRIGEVRKIELVSASDARVANRPADAPPIPDPDVLLVTVAIPKKYPVRAGYRVAVQTSFTGQSALNFESLGAAKEVPADVALIGRPGGFSEVFAAFQDIRPHITGTLKQANEVTMPTLNGALADVRDKTIPAVNDAVTHYKTTADHATETIDKIKGHVDPAAAKVHQVSDRTSEMMVQVRDLVGDTKTDFRGTMANLNSATGSVKDKLPGILEKVDSAVAEVNVTVKGATEAMEDIKKVADNARDLTASAKGVISGNKGKLDGMIASLKATSDNLKNATAEVRRSPWRLLYKPSGKETANLNIYDAARQFAEGATNLNDTATALRDALNQKDADPEHIKKLMKEVEESFSRFNDVEKKLWSEVKE